MQQRKQPSRPLRAAQHLMVSAAADAAAVTAGTPETVASRPKLVPDNWQKIVDHQAAEETVTGTITDINKGGVIVDVYGIQGFVPYSRLDPLRAPSQAEIAAAVSGSKDSDQGSKALVGESITAKILTADVAERLLVLSERAAQKSAFLSTVKKGDVVQAVVQALTDYGAFVGIKGPDGAIHGAEALIHKSELSWDRIMRPEQVVKVGDEVTAVVTKLDKAKGRLALSMKRLEADPLKETLDGVLPAVQDGAESLVPVDVPQSIEQVVAELEKEEGITAINLGRQVEERRTVAQDLEIYISKKEVANGYSLVARAGRIVQEVNITTDLDPAGLKAAMQRALKRLV